MLLTPFAQTEPVNTPTTAYSPQTSVSTPMSSFTQGEASDFQAQNFMSAGKTDKKGLYLYCIIHLYLKQMPNPY